MSIIKRKAGSEDIVKSVLEFDAVPTEGSPNLVESGAVAKAIAEGGSSYSAGDGIAIVNDVISARVDGSTVEISDGKIAVKSRPRYTTRTETATSFPASFNVNDGESVIYKVTTSATTANIYIAAPAGTTDAQVVVVKTSGYFVPTISSVTVGGVDLPIIDTRAPNYRIDTGYEYGILKSATDESTLEVPSSFDEVALVYRVLTQADLMENSKYTNTMVVQIVGQVALLLAK